MRLLKQSIIFLTFNFVFSMTNVSAAELPDWTKNVGSRTRPSGNFKVDVAQYGAIGDGKTLCTKNIQAAIDACAEKGGGRVEFPKGEYLTGALFVKSNVELHIGEDVTLRAIRNIDHFPEMPTRIAGIEMVWPVAIINVIGQKNVAITGKGLIDGDGVYHWYRFWEMFDDYTKRGLHGLVDYDCKRVRMVLVSDSEDVTLSGFTLTRSSFWTITLLYSTQCTVSGITIRNTIGGFGPSVDGINMDSSSHILVENCDVDCNDDNICLKSGRGVDGLRVNRPTEYVLIRNCITRHGEGISCGSETAGGIRYIYCVNSKAIGTSATLRIKSAMNRGGTVEHIYMDNVETYRTPCFLNCEVSWNPSYSYPIIPPEYEGKELPPHWTKLLTRVPSEQGIPTFRNIFISNITGNKVRTFVKCDGAENSIIDGVSLSNVNVQAGTAGTVKYTRNFTMNNVQLKTDDDSQIVVEDIP